MSQRRVNETSLTATADALRAKLGTSDPIPWVENEGFKEAVESIQTDSGGADVSGVTATETEVLENAIFVDAHGEYKEGTIPRNGDTSATFDGIETKSVEIPAGFTTGGTVALDGTIDGHVDAQATLIAEIAEALENKAAGAGGPLQAKTVYPSHTEQIIAPDEDFYGLVSVTVKPVPRLPVASVLVTAETYIATHRSYDGVRLPAIPEDLLAQYPYAWIWNNTELGRYELVLATGAWYYTDSVLYGTGMNRSVSETSPIYAATLESEEWSFVEDNSSSKIKVSGITWTNTSIPYDSVTGWNIYKRASTPSYIL